MPLPSRADRATVARTPSRLELSLQAISRRNAESQCSAVADDTLPVQRERWAERRQALNRRLDAIDAQLAALAAPDAARLRLVNVESVDDPAESCG